MKHIHSTDPVKKLVVNAIKLKSGANKVTLVKEVSEGVYQGHALKTNGRGAEMTSLGTVTVTKEELSL